MPTTPNDFDGLRVAAFESRRREEMARLIEKRRGVPFVSPSMREVTLQENRHLIDFANRLITGQVDMVILLTGVGTRQLVTGIERHVDRQRFLDALSDIKTVARGPKPVAALREFGLAPTLRVPEPNTWREVLATLDQHTPLANMVVAVQEYGVSNVSLIAGLEARGARVEKVPVYRWDLPEDTAPLEANVRRIVAGEVDIAVFTSAQQIEHMLQIARSLQLEQPLREGFHQVAIASVGPSTSEMLRQHSLPVDFQPSHPKLIPLLNELAEQSNTLVRRKRTLSARLVAENAEQTKRTPQPWDDSPFMRACRRQSVPYTPIWLMRQAGRYMPEYRAIREKHSFLELCKNPQLCSEVMCTAVERLGVDAAIIFSDLLPILQPMGMELEYVAGDGPKIDNPVREASDVHRVLELENVDSLSFVVETVRQTRADLPESIPLIGFAGAPFTLASYAIEGGSSRQFLHTKSLMYRQPDAWHDLMARLARSVAIYLNAQIRAGVQAVQLFDSWVGCLGPRDYRQYVLPHVQQLVAELLPDAPLIHFGTGNPALLPLMAEAGGEVLGLDWRIELADGWKAVGEERAIQGNLDPLVLLADRETIAARADSLLQQAANRPGHIFNLGHGVLQQTPVDNVRYLVEYVHERSARRK